MTESPLLRVSKEVEAKVMAAKTAEEVTRILRDEAIAQGLLAPDPESQKAS